SPGPVASRLVNVIRLTRAAIPLVAPVQPGDHLQGLQLDRFSPIVRGGAIPCARFDPWYIALPAAVLGDIACAGDRQRPGMASVPQGVDEAAWRGLGACAPGGPAGRFTVRPGMEGGFVHVNRRRKGGGNE